MLTIFFFVLQPVWNKSFCKINAIHVHHCNSAKLKNGLASLLTDIQIYFEPLLLNSLKIWASFYLLMRKSR